MKKLWNTLAALVIILILLGVFRNLIDSNVTPKKKNNTTTGYKANEINGQKQENEKNKKEFLQNETVEFGGVEYKITNVVKSSGSQFDKPKSGCEYVIVYISIVNKSNEKISYNSFDWQMENSRGQETTYIWGGDIDTALSSGDLNPNGYVEGSITFEQPIGDEGLKLNFYDNVLVSNEPDFKFILGSRKNNNNFVYGGTKSTDNTQKYINNNQSFSSNSSNGVEYSREELINAAYNYYIAKHGYSSIGVALDHYDGDNAVICINEDTPERVLVLDWYTVDVYTGEGTDFNGNYIDIMDPPESSTNSYIDDEYIFPYSNSQYLTDSDLWSMSSEELRIARNEIYARYGRMFKDQGLQNYFNSKSWYTPSVRPEDFNEQWLNEYEKANAKLIKSFE